jgi:hypothetical protein
VEVCNPQLDVSFHAKGVNWLCDIQQSVNLIDSGGRANVVRTDSVIVLHPECQGDNQEGGKAHHPDIRRERPPATIL